MIRDTQTDDVDFYVVDELQKRILIKNYHPIFQLEVSQFESAPIEIEEPEEENKITILTDPIVEANIEQTITINVEDFGGIKYRKINDNYIQLSTVTKGYYYNHKFYSDYKYEKPITAKNNVLFIDYETQKQYISSSNTFIEVENIIPGILNDNVFTPFFTNYDNYPEVNAAIVGSIDNEEDEEISEEPEEVIVRDITNDYLDEEDSEYNINDTNIFITYDNVIQLVIKDINNKTLHIAQFPHLAYGSVEYNCIFTEPGLYSLIVTLIKNGNEIKEQSFNIDVVSEGEINDFIEVSYTEVDEEENNLYVPNKIGNRIINPRINQPTNLKCSLNSLILDNHYIRDLLNSNRSNIVFTSPTNKDYQVYQFESHNIYNNKGEIEDTWFFIRADFIDEYIELHILPTYINAMDNIILLSDNDMVDYFLHTKEESVTDNEPETKMNINLKDIDNDEYVSNTINGEDIVITKVPICSEPQWFDIEIMDSNYKVSFDCYNSYYYRSVFYINDLQIYNEDDNVYLQYNDYIDVIPYDLLDKGEHNIEFSIEDDRMTLGIDEYIISTDIFDNIDVPAELRIGFQQTKLNNPITEILAIDDIDGYTYISNLLYESIFDDEETIDVTKAKLQPNEDDEAPMIYKFPLNLSRNFAKLEIDIIRKGLGSNIIGVIDRTNLVEKKLDTSYTLNGSQITGPVTIYDSYDEVTLLDLCKYENEHTHVPIQYNNDDEFDGVFFENKNVYTTTLNIEEISPIKEIPNNQYNYSINSNQINVIQTLKYFNDDLYSEAYVQSSSTLLDPLTLIRNKQYYNQHWLDKEDTDTEYYEVNSHGQA